MLKNLLPSKPGTEPLAEALRACKTHFIWAFVFSALVNLLYLTPTLYMMQVYDRVVPTVGLTTLVLITAVAVFALAALAASGMPVAVVVAVSEARAVARMVAKAVARAVTTAVTVAVVVGPWTPARDYINPETGIGYWLGIVGGRDSAGSSLGRSTCSRLLVLGGRYWFG